MIKRSFEYTNLVQINLIGDYEIMIVIYKIYITSYTSYQVWTLLAVNLIGNYNKALKFWSECYPNDIFARWLSMKPHIKIGKSLYYQYFNRWTHLALCSRVKWNSFKFVVTCYMFISGFIYTAWKVSVFGIFLVRIFQHSNWLRDLLCKCPYSV